jgi:hypothetical protein
MGIVKRSVPVVAGRAPVVVDICAACKTGTPEIRVRAVAGGMDMTLCMDFIGCGRRYRGGLTHAQYAESLRAAVAVAA